MQIAASGSSFGPSRLNTVTAELEETKESLKKAKEESLLMANCVASLKEELELAKRELHQLKVREPEKQPIEFEIEDLKFVEDSTQVEENPPLVHLETEFQRKRYVKFADSPSLARVMTIGEAVLEENPSLNKKKKKKLSIPLIGFFSKKKGHQEVRGF